MSRARRPPSDALLCERCGYDLEGMARDDNCPECGRAIVESLPERRSGTPWQRRLMSPWSWAGVVLVSLIRPRKTWKSARLRTRYWDFLLSVNIVLAGLIAGCSIANVSRRMPSVYGDYLPLICVSLAIALIYLIIRVLVGMQLVIFGHVARKKNRAISSEDVARTVVAHTSFWWILAGLGIGALYLWAGHVQIVHIMGCEYAPLIMPLRISGQGTYRLKFQTISVLWPWLASPVILSAVMSQVWGLLGLRAMRYANGPGAERHLRDYAGEANISTEPASPRRM